MKLLHFVHQTATRLFYVALIFSVASGLSNAALAGVISQLIAGREGLSNRFLGGFALLVLVAVLCDFGAKQALNLLITRMNYALQLSFSGQVLTTPFSRLEQIGNPRLFTLLAEDSQVIGRVIADLPTVAIGIATVVGCLLYLIWLAPGALVGISLLALPVFGSYWWLQTRTNAIALQNLFLRDQLFSAYRDLTDGIKELTLHLPRLSAFYHAHLQPLAANLQANTIRYLRYHFLAQSVNQFTYFFLLFGLFVISRWLQTPLEVLGAYALMILYMKSATMTLVSALPRWAEASTVVTQIEALGFTLLAPKAIAGVPETSALTPDLVEIKLQDLTYLYPGGVDESPFVLGPLTFRLQPGEIVFIVGGNGSGKTTFLKLLIGLYTPNTGRILWNGTPVTAGTLDRYRQNFAVLFAEPYLFPHLLGLEWEKLDEDAQHWLQRLQMAHKVQVVDGKLSTLDLSFGQRKRLALLTAYLEARPVYLFDEWAAGQDPEFRELFYRTLLPELKAQGKLVIVISHDDHYFDVADRVIKFDNGAIEYDTAQTHPVDQTRGALVAANGHVDDRLVVARK
ncbi:MAG: cyclic peptide export ABC transporter [Caldilineaceae bacterium]|nr:cyclic peptide export ABC transporter [Caldilineaceae bacterium]